MGVSPSQVGDDWPRRDSSRRRSHRQPTQEQSDDGDEDQQGTEPESQAGESEGSPGSALILMDTAQGSRGIGSRILGRPHLYSAASCRWIARATSCHFPAPGCPRQLWFTAYDSRGGESVVTVSLSPSTNDSGPRVASCSTIALASHQIASLVPTGERVADLQGVPGGAVIAVGFIGAGKHGGSEALLSGVAVDLSLNHRRDQGSSIRSSCRSSINRRI